MVLPWCTGIVVRAGWVAAVEVAAMDMVTGDKLVVSLADFVAALAEALVMMAQTVAKGYGDRGLSHGQFFYDRNSGRD